MSPHSTKDLPKGPASLASSLLETLQEERAALERLRGHFDRHIEAVRTRDRQLIDDAASGVSEDIHELAGLKQSRDRKVRLLGRVLQLDGESAGIEEISEALSAAAHTEVIARQLSVERERIRNEAALAQKRCRDLEFALEYAVRLGRELLQTIHGLDGPAGIRVYTPHGGAVESTSSPRSFVNRIG